MGASDGYFPRESSVLRRVHEQRAVGLLYGQRALAIGAIKPLNFIGTINHTRAREAPFRRLVRTANAFETIFFGSREEADRVLAIVERMHERVEGELTEDAGPVKAGTPYSAFDPAEMLWTVAAIADSARAFHEMLVRPLSRAELDALWADYVRFGELFGMPREVAPASWAEFDAYFDEQVNGPGAHLVPDAVEVGLAIMFEIPVPATRKPAMQLHNLVIKGSLPPRIRELYGLSWSAAEAAAFRAAVTALRGSRPLVPRRVRRGPNASQYDLVARTEKTRIARGKKIPGSLSPSAS